MLRNMAIGAVVGMATLIGTSGGWAQTPTPTPTYTYGVFRENVANVPDDQRNCWVQAMVSGDTINGELLAERLTQQQAEDTLQRDAHRGFCASQRTASNWSARDHTGSGSGWSNSGQ
jgi:hypothetical protein